MQSFVISLCFIIVTNILHTNAADLFGRLGDVIGVGNNNRNQPPLFGNTNNNPLGTNSNFNPRQPTDSQFRFRKPDSSNGGTGGTDGGDSLFRFQGTTKKPGSSTARGTIELTEEEKLAAQKFPGLKNLLEQLKELNRQKELQKNNGGQTGNDKTDNNIDDKGNGGDSTGEVAKNGWRVMRRRKFVFQVKPVRPDNEKVTENEVVYYMD